MNNGKSFSQFHIDRRLQDYVNETHVQHDYFSSINEIESFL